MNPTRAWWFGCLGLVLGGAWLAWPSDTIQADAARGRELFFGRGRCAECHRYEGEGSFARGPSLDAHWASGPALRDRLAQRRAAGAYPEAAAGDAYLLASLLEPDAVLAPGFDAGMPPAHGPVLGLSRQDVADLLAYLNPGPAARAVPELDAPGPNPWDTLPGGDPARGEGLFFRPDDAACKGCHLIRLPRLEQRYHPPFWRQGGLSGPELTRSALIRGPEDVLRAILRPGAARTGGYQDVLLETTGERLLTGLLLADGAPGVLLMEADPSGPYYRWIERENIAEVTPVPRSRMTHVFPEILDLQERLDLLAFLRAVAGESAALGADGLPGHRYGVRDPVYPLYTGVWPEAAAPEQLRAIPGLEVVE